MARFPEIVDVVIHIEPPHEQIPNPKLELPVPTIPGTRIAACLCMATPDFVQRFDRRSDPGHPHRPAHAHPRRDCTGPRRNSRAGGPRKGGGDELRDCRGRARVRRHLPACRGRARHRVPSRLARVDRLPDRGGLLCIGGFFTSIIRAEAARQRSCLPRRNRDDFKGELRMDSEAAVIRAEMSQTKAELDYKMQPAPAQDACNDASRRWRAASCRSGRSTTRSAAS